MKKEIPWNLIISKLQQRITVEEDRQLLKWLDDNRNKEVFDELQQVWQKVQNNASDYVPDSDHYWKELSKRISVQSSPKIELKPKATHASFANYFRRYAAVACIMLAITFSVSFYIGMEVAQPQVAELVYNNLAGKSKIILPDGTEVWLHSNTSLTYSTRYDWKQRQIKLVGEAYFDVAHNKDKPFIVQTEGMKVIVHGTKFNIESFPASTNIFVSLVEGSVSLETSEEHNFLHPGEMAVYNKGNHHLSIQKSDVSYATSWANDKMIFTNKSLGEICRFLSKWYNVKIHLEPGLENKYKYTFTLRNEPLEEILRLMSRINPTAYQFSEENELTIFSKPLK